MRYAWLILLLAVSPVAADDEPLSERWALKAVPAQLPSLPNELYGRTWSYQPPRSRTGRGYSEYLTFRKPADGKPGEVELRHVMHLRAGQGERETSRTLPLKVETSLLEFGGVLRTAALHDDKLVLNAGVPVGKKLWYLVQCDTFTTPKVRVNEYLFDFADDPRIVDEGKVTVTQTRTLFPDGKPEQREHSATFAVAVKSDQQRSLALQTIAVPGQSTFNLPRIILWNDRPYLSLDEPNRRAVEYVLAEE